MLIVNPNFTIDRTIRLDVMVPGAVHRTGPAEATLGGKGVNVARVARAFGRPGVLIGFLPALSASDLMALAASDGAELSGIPIGGTVRGASILLERSGRVSVFNEPGPTVEEVDWARLLGEVQRHAPSHQTVVCSGSLPPGSPPDAYARVIRVARQAGRRTVVDAAGAVLLAALEAAPDVVSPNLGEAEALISGATIEDVEPSGAMVVERAAEAARGLVVRGARMAIVSMGSHGAVLSRDGETVFCPAPEVAVVNPIGAGDSLIGGLVHALESGEPWDRAALFGLAVASASCEHPMAGGVDVTRARVLAGALQTRPLAPVLEPTRGPGSPR